jgi:hypothetical protein
MYAITLMAVHEYPRCWAKLSDVARNSCVRSEARESIYNISAPRGLCSL